jgi:hypothetical protein
MTTTERTRTDVERVVRETLAAHPALYLATSGELGPWVGGTFFVDEDVFDLALVLETHGRTLTAIRRNPRVAVVVSSGNPFEPFLQAQAVATILGGPEVDAVGRALVAKVPQAEAFLSHPHEAVRLTVAAWRATDVVNGWLPGLELRNPALEGAAAIRHPE